MRRQAIAALSALALTLVFILVDQARDEGFQKGHRGWCSAHVLAMIEHATAENGFVGYTLEYVTPDGKRDYWYFDRYPVFFTVGMHALLNAVELSKSTQIYVARQAMNVLHAITLLFGVMLLMELGLAPGIAVASVALAASGKLMVSYRDMVHFDQAALLGFMGLLWAIARWYRKPNDRFVYAAAAIAVLMGRGYASFSVLAVWWVLEAVQTLRRPSRDAPRALFWGVQARACLLAIALAGSCLGYNIWREAEMRDVSITQVGIVHTAIKRLTLDPEFNRKQSKSLAWSRFTETTARRGVSNLQPYFLEDVIPRKGRGLWLAVAVVAGLVGFFVASRERKLRVPALVAALAGLAWVFPMRGLTAFHEFTTMFLLSLSALLMASLLRFVPDRVQIVPALLACLCLGVATHERNDWLRARESRGVAYTEDLRRIEALLEPGDPIQILPKDPKKLVPGVPYAIGFLLPDQPIMREGRAPYLVTSQKKKHQPTLTPNNTRLFLYRR